MHIQLTPYTYPTNLLPPYKFLTSKYFPDLQLTPTHFQLKNVIFKQDLDPGSYYVHV